MPNESFWNRFMGGQQQSSRFGQGTTGLTNIADTYLPEEIDYWRKRRGQTQGVVDSFLNEDPYAFGQKYADTYSDSLFRAGGPISDAFSQAYSGGIQAGFGPEGSRGKLDKILGSAAEEVGRQGMMQAGQMRQNQYGLAGNVYGAEAGQANAGIGSLFNAYGSIASLMMAQEEQKRNKPGALSGFLSKIF